MVVKRFEVYLVQLDPTVGSETRKTRPAIIVSPKEMNDNLSTVIIAPLTSKGKPYPCRVKCQFQGKQGLVMLDQIRTVDQSRLKKKLGSISQATATKILELLTKIFS